MTFSRVSPRASKTPSSGLGACLGALPGPVLVRSSEYMFMYLGLVVKPHLQYHFCNDFEEAERFVETLQGPVRARFICPQLQIVEKVLVRAQERHEFGLDHHWKNRRRMWALLRRVSSLRPFPTEETDAGCDTNRRTQWRLSPLQ